MAHSDRTSALMAAFRKTAYFKWMARQGIPIIEGYGVEDVREVVTAPWARTGGKAAFISGKPISSMGAD